MSTKRAWSPGREDDDGEGPRKKPRVDIPAVCLGDGSCLFDLLLEGGGVYRRRPHITCTAQCQPTHCDRCRQWAMPGNRGSDDKCSNACVTDDDDDHPPLPRLAQPVILPPIVVKETAASARVQLSSAQEKVVQYVLRYSHQHVMITGGAGTGKSTLLGELTRRLGGQAVLTASTGIAGQQIGGRTIHSWAGIGIGLESAEVIADKIENTRPGKRWRAAQTLVIDEVSMLDAPIFDLLDQVGRLVRHRPMQPFGGLRLILVGDLLQLPPIDKAKKEPRFVIQSDVWPQLDIKVFQLQVTYRQDDTSEFAAMLAEIRRGNCSERTTEMLLSRLNWRHPQDRPISHIYPKNQDVDRVNIKRLSELPGSARTYEASEWTMTKDKAAGARSMADPFRDIRAPRSLLVKVGAQVMMLKNAGDINPSLVNGSIGIVHALEDDAILIDFGEAGNAVWVTREGFEVHDADRVLVATRTQFPLMLAWALTGHKSQGQTITCNVIVDLATTFEDGQAYVMLSRVKRLEQLSLTSFHPEAIRANTRIVSWYDGLPKLED